MKPRYIDLPLDYEPWSGTQPVFRRGAERYRPEEFRQGKLADDSHRQQHFEDQLRRISAALRSDEVPFYVRWSGGEKLRLDRGCVGHSYARRVIDQLIPDENGFVSRVRIRS